MEVFCNVYIMSCLEGRVEGGVWSVEQSTICLVDRPESSLQSKQTREGQSVGPALLLSLLCTSPLSVLFPLLLTGE